MSAGERREFVQLLVIMMREGSDLERVVAATAILDLGFGFPDGRV